MYYIATTIRIGLSGEFNSNTPLELTLGGGVGRKSGVFVGFELPFTWQFRLLAEHDIRRVTAGVEYRPFTGAGVRLMVRDEGPLVGFRYSMRF